MRRVLAWVLVVLGVVVLVPAIAAAVWVGTDDTATTGPHALTSAGVAVVSEPEVLHYVGPVLHLTVANTDGSPVFVGIAHEVDAASYLGESSRLVVSRVGLPWDVESAGAGGAATALPPPGEQPWWLLTAEGAGPQEIVWPIPNGRYSIVGLNADGSPGVDLQVTLGLEIEGTFYTLLAIAAFGLLLALLGLWLLLWRRGRRQPDEAAVETLEPAVGSTAAYGDAEQAAAPLAASAASYVPVDRGVEPSAASAESYVPSDRGVAPPAASTESYVPADRGDEPSAASTESYVPVDRGVAPPGGSTAAPDDEVER